MHITKIILHGFKSYGTRTIIAEFDKHFNAITGLNGSGKSNVFDAICFLLGQNAPTLFRVQNLQELVYKKGAGGIQFASVTIVFDNRNKQQCPVGQSNRDEITVERKITLGAQGKSKYLLNGANSTLTAIVDLFRSVQLNISNPHFLIMQGRIVKVLNMKAEETWKMVEEAAGTMVYLMKRDSTLKTVHSKQKRIDEVDEVIRTQIAPAMQRLEATRKNAAEFNRVTREIEKAERVKAAVEAFHYKNKAIDMQKTREKAKERVLELTAEKETVQQELVSLEDKIKVLEGADHNQNDELQRLEKAAQAARHKVDQITAAIENNSNLIKEEQSAIADRKNEIAQKDRGVEGAHDKLNKIREERAKAEARKAELEEEVRQASQALAVIVTGVGGQENAQYGWKNQLQTAERELLELDRIMNNKRGNLANTKKQLPKPQDLERLQQENQAMMNQMRRLEEEVGVLEQELAAAPVADQVVVARLRQQYKDNVGRMARLNQLLHNADNELSGLNLRYTRPRNFDDRSFYGAVAKLFTVKDERFLAAIDQASGGKKFHFAVEDENTAKALLKEGEIRRRVTILPLNRMRGSAITDAEMKRIRDKVGANKVWSALELVEFDIKFTSVMHYALGHMVVCFDLDVGNRVAFELNKHCVTLDGDSLNPDGIVSGGSRTPLNQLVLFRVCNYNKVKQEMDTIREEEQTLKQEQQQLDQQDAGRKDIEGRLREKRNELNALNHRCDQNAGLRNARDVQKMREEIEKLENELEEGRVRREELVVTIDDLKVKLSDENAHEREKQEAEKKEAKCREALKKHENVVAAVGEKEARLQAENEDIQKGTDDIKAEIKQKEKLIQEYETANAKKNTELEPADEIYKQAQAKYTRLKNEISKKNAEQQDTHKQKRDTEKKLSKMDSDIEKAQSAVVKGREELKALQAKLNEMFEAHHWLHEEYDKLGTPESTYADIENQPLARVAAELEKLTKRRTELQRLGGTEQNQNFDQLTRQYEELVKKNNVIKQDKTRLEAIIEQLDLKKQNLIEVAVTEVNKHFGAIFKTLLPNADCKLERVKDDNGESVEALRVRVALGNLWKESLAELSGGQRSLVALSLILAMLKMNPAPIYILDEVDAALDLNHTANVGKMIRKYFKQSQFIMVSLKEGMFNNANIVFHVSLQDGVSVVERKIGNRGGGDQGDDSDDSS